MTRLFGTPSAPLPALRAGYNLCTFSTTPGNGGFTSSNVTSTTNAGFKWYAITSNYTLNTDKTASLGKGNPGLFQTVGVPSPPTFHGIAFGGGAYFEWTASWTPALFDLTTSWPALWVYALEAVTGTGLQWGGGQPSNVWHWTEFDGMENGPNSPSTLNVAYSTAHDWYNLGQGAGSQNVQAQLTNFNLPADIGTNFHKFGLLWIPATNLTPGKISIWIDNVQQGSTRTYVLFDPTTDPPPPLSNSPWLFGIADRNHLFPVMNGATNASVKMQAVRVFQKSAANNLTN